MGYERVQEIEDPELATQRTRALYKAKGYSDAWIEKRMRGIAVREELTEEWQQRGVGGEKEYAILTAEISKATFGLTPSEYKDHKGWNFSHHKTPLPKAPFGAPSGHDKTIICIFGPDEWHLRRWDGCGPDSQRRRGHGGNPRRRLCALSG